MNYQQARFTGARGMQSAPPGHGQGPGVCKSCGCGSAECSCGCRQCRKEAKELTFTADAKGRYDAVAGGLVVQHLMQDQTASAAGAAGAVSGAPVHATAFVGGGCCVHISLEYAPIAATAASRVGILVRDTEGTIMVWEKADPPGTHYQVKENVVTTKPGATITLLAANATVRARWCEVFSC